jgi:hypothetical protein
MVFRGRIRGGLRTENIAGHLVERFSGRNQALRSIPGAFIARFMLI